MQLINPLPFKPPRLFGLSAALMSDHYQTAYGKDVQQLNALRERLGQLDCATTNASGLQALHAELSGLANSVALHEVYFDCLGGKDGLGSPAVAPTGDLAAAIVQSFGSYAQWQQQFAATANAASVPGWLVMNWTSKINALSLQLIQQNDTGQIDAIPVMGIDLFEHAYQADFKSDRSAYIDAFMQNLHWDRPLKRFHRATHCIGNADVNNDSSLITPEMLFATVNGGRPIHVLDVCLTDDIPDRYDTLPNAQFVQAESIDDWIEDIPENTSIVAYCMYGFQVSENAVKALQQRGFRAKKLAGGIASWRALGLPTNPFKR